MAKIIDSIGKNRRIIRLTTADVLSVVREYQNNVKRYSNYTQTIEKLSDIVIYIPEDI